MKNVAIVSCNLWMNKIKEDLFLQFQLIKDGYNAEIISWEDCNINYDNYDCLILRSVWGYHNKYLEFKNWLLDLKSKNIIVFNDADMILSNIRKDLQFRILDDYCISHIPTIFVKNTDELECVENQKEGLVVKPIISGSGNNTFLLNAPVLEKSDKVINQSELKFIYKDILKVEDNGLMIQPYISEIKNGEYSCIYIDGINTHNMLRFPGIFTQKQKPLYLDNIPNKVKQLANKVSNIPEYKNHLYMRIDIVEANDNVYIMEVELAEPDLMLKYINDEKIRESNIKLLAKKIEGRLK